MKKEKLLEGERVDDMGFGGLRLIQKPDEFCYGIDAVLLADFAGREQRVPEKIIDLGAGTGAVSLILSYKYRKARITEVEMQEGASDRAVRNITLNGLGRRLDVIRGDILDLPDSMCGKYDMAVTNPPYFEAGSGLIPGSGAKTASRHETTASLSDFFAAAAALLRDRGDLFMVHRPSRLADMMTFSRIAGVEPKVIRFVQPYRDEDPNIVLAHFIKGGGRELRVMPPLIVRERDGRYTDEIDEIYGRK